MSNDLFPETKPPRSKPRVMMHGDDFGYDGDITLAHMVCGKCGHVGGWLMFANDTEARRGEPCPQCNTTAAAGGEVSQPIRKLRILAGMLLSVFDSWREDVWPKDLDGRYCCNGRECGCGGATLGEVYGEKS